MISKFLILFAYELYFFEGLKIFFIIINHFHLINLIVYEVDKSSSGSNPTNSPENQF